MFHLKSRMNNNQLLWHENSTKNCLGRHSLNAIPLVLFTNFIWSSRFSHQKKVERKFKADFHPIQTFLVQKKRTETNKKRYSRFRSIMFHVSNGLRRLQQKSCLRKNVQCHQFIFVLKKICWNVYLEKWFYLIVDFFFARNGRRPRNLMKKKNEEIGDT